uniref:Uncharacterized protein n=1 Tax=Syphacia muris TaxID=451379 RepID=A0A0N5AY99_9BILA
MIKEKSKKKRRITKEEWQNGFVMLVFGNGVKTVALALDSVAAAAAAASETEFEAEQITRYKLLLPDVC